MNFYTDVTTGSTSYPANAQIVLSFVPDQWHLKNLSLDTTVFYSFDGVNDHGQVQPTSPATSGIPNIGDTVPSKNKNLWVRKGSGVSATVTLSSQASTTV